MDTIRSNIFCSNSKKKNIITGYFLSCPFAGSFFPPRDKTGADIVHIWDKDLCRTLPLKYHGSTEKSGIKADLYIPPESVFGRPNESAPENECFCSDDISMCPSNGLQNISPCQYSKSLLCSIYYYFFLIIFIRKKKKELLLKTYPSLISSRTGLSFLPPLLQSGS